MAAKGMIDEVRLYKKSFGSEDVHFAVMLITFTTKLPETKSKGGSGSVIAVEAPVVPSLTLPTLRVGDSVDNLSIGTAEGIEISISGLPVDWIT